VSNISTYIKSFLVTQLTINMQIRSHSQDSNHVIYGSW